MHFKFKNEIKWCQFLILIYAMIILNNLVNTGHWNKKKTQILMKDNKQTTLHSFSIRTILKRQWDLLGNKKNLKTINAEINKKTFYPSLENRNVL